MSNYKTTFFSVILSLVIIIIGLFFVCSRHPAIEDEELADLEVDEGEFEQDLISLLDLTGTTSTSDSSGAVPEKSPEDIDVLTVMEQQPEQAGEQALITPVHQEGVTGEMISKMKTEIDRLDGLLGQRSSTADSLHRIIEKKNARIAELEKIVSEAQGGKTVQFPHQKARRNTAQRTRSTQPSTTASEGFDKKYQQARGLFEAYKYHDAIVAFESLLAESPEHALADNCQYWIGECYFGLKQYQKAALEFQKVFAYSHKDKYDDAQLMIGLAYLRNGETEKARYEFESLLTNYANSEYVSIAEKYIERI